MKTIYFFFPSESIKKKSIDNKKIFFKPVRSP